MNGPSGMIEAKASPERLHRYYDFISRFYSLIAGHEPTEL